MDSRAVASSFLASWAAQDVEMTVMHLHPCIFYKIHVATEIRPFGGERRGVEQCREAMFTVLADFDYLEYVPTIVSVMGNVVRAQVSYKCRHRRTGTLLEGTRRLVIRVQEGLIDRVDSYHDARLVEVFMRLTQHRDAIRPPELPKREKEGSGLA